MSFGDFSSHSLVDDPITPGLYVVATPIGHLQDLSLRGRQVLMTAALVVSESRDRTRALLASLGVSPALLVWHDDRPGPGWRKIQQALDQGQIVALVCDAGTPGVADPGASLVDLCWKDRRQPIPVPGPSALSAVMSVCGWRSRLWQFAGFLPRKTGDCRQTLQAASVSPSALVFFESPRRIGKTLKMVAELWPADRSLVVAREVTKKFEDIHRVTVQDAADIYPKPPLGEITVAIAGDDERLSRSNPAGSDNLQHAERLLHILLRHIPLSQAVQEVCTLTQEPRSAVYAAALQAQKRMEKDLLTAPSAKDVNQA